MKEIPLTRGYVALVDDEDYDKVASYCWSAYVTPRHNTPYAITRMGKKSCVYMHRFLLGAPAGILVDHQDGNGLNNRRNNLRRATNQQNGANRRPVRGRQYKGTYLKSKPHQTPLWEAQIRVNGKLHSGGYARTEEAAAKLYDAAAIKYFGEFARLNFPREDYQTREEFERAA